MSQKRVKSTTKIPSPINRLLNGNLTSNSNNNTNTSSASNLIMATNEFEKVDKKLFDKINKSIDKVVRLCQQEKLNLINSPPYIIDILPDIYNHLSHIAASYENKMHILNEIDYFVIFMNNLHNKCDKVIKLFREAGKRMFEETSNDRKELIKYSLTFSHLLAELKSLFPSYVYEGLNFRIAKADAADFWKNNFSEKIIVSWNDFQHRLNLVHLIHNEESEHLRKTIQLTGTKFVSIFEFDVFTRLFQPWNTLLNNWKLLAVIHAAYGAFMTYDEVVKQLQNHIDKPGSYLFRLSCTKLGQWAIGYVTSDRKILQTIPQSLVQALIDGERQGIYVYPNGRDIRIDLSQLAVSSAERIKISREQYDMYCDMGTSFQLCKICSENNKDRKLEPCGHLICARCLENWQEKHTVAASCPFCRCEIKAFEPIIISPFDSEVSQKSSSINGISNNKTVKDDFNGSFESDSLAQSTSRSDLMAISLPPPLPPVPPPIIPSNQLKSIKKHELVKNSNNGENNSNSEQDDEFSHEDYLKPSNSKKINNENIADNENKILSHTDLRSSIISSCHSNTALNFTAPPNPPPPPPPPVSAPPIPPPISIPPHQQPRLSSPISSPSITSLQSVIKKDENKLKIENERLVNHLTKQGFDRIKSACALAITNNNLDLALEILTKYTNKLSTTS